MILPCRGSVSRAREGALLTSGLARPASAAESYRILTSQWRTRSRRDREGRTRTTARLMDRVVLVFDFEAGGGFVSTVAWSKTGAS